MSIYDLIKSMSLDLEKTEEIVDFLTNHLGGDWLLTGGSLVRLKFDVSRGTEDVDIVRMSHPDLSDEASREKLFSWLIDKGLGPEWVNTAVEPFVKEILNWKNEVVEIYSGSKGKVFRPNITLFVYLKLRRGTEIDLEDIKTVAPKCRESFDELKFRSWASTKVIERLNTLRKHFDFSSLD